jgi:hypothetical protein
MRAMSDRVLALDDLWRYCIKSNDVLFSKDRGSGIFVTRYGFYHDAFPKVYVWILYHPSNPEPIDSLFKVLDELRRSERIARVTDDKGDICMVLVSYKKWFRRYVVKYEVAKYRVLLPGDIIAYSGEGYRGIKFKLYHHSEGITYPGYFAVILGQAFDLVGLEQYPSAIHILLVGGAFKVASILSSVSLPTVDEVVRREVLEDFKELLSLKYTEFALKEIERLYKALMEEKKQG